jgi:hypothetical protein
MMNTLDHVLMGAPTLRPDVPAIVALALMTVAAFLAAARLFRWDKDDPLPRRAKLSALLALTPIIVFGVWQNMSQAPAAAPPPPPPPAQRAR